MRLKTLYLSFLFSFLFSLVTPAHASQVLSQGFPDMVDNAGYVFQGEFVGQELQSKTSEHFSEGLNVVSFHFQVKKWIKGNRSDLSFKNEQVTYQQWMGISSSLNKNTRNLYPYKKGKEYVVFLNKLSPQTGLTTPLGLGKGIFAISSQAGQQKVKFPFGPKKATSLENGLMKSVDASDSEVLSLEEFLKKIDSEL